MKKLKPFDLARDLLDHELVDVDEVPCGRVDDIELEHTSHGLAIAALLVGVSRELDDAARLADPATVRLVRAFDKVHDATTRESIVEGVELIVARKGTDNAASRRSRGGRTRRRSNQRT